MNAKFPMTIFLIIVLMIAAACESIALMPRPSIDDTVDRNRIERSPEIGRIDREPNRDIARDEIIGTVQRVDFTRRELHLRTRERNLLVFGYDRNAVVFDRDRDLPIEALRSGDQISVRPRASSVSERYADVIRLIDRRSEMGSYSEY